MLDRTQVIKRHILRNRQDGNTIHVDDLTRYATDQVRILTSFSSRTHDDQEGPAFLTVSHDLFLRQTLSQDIIVFYLWQFSRGHTLVNVLADIIHIRLYPLLQMMYGFFLVYLISHRIAQRDRCREIGTEIDMQKHDLRPDHSRIIDTQLTSLNGIVREIDRDQDQLVPHLLFLLRILHPFIVLDNS